MAVGFLMYFLQRFGIFENFHNQILGFKKNESLAAEKGKVLKWPQTKTPLLIVKFEFNHLSLLQHLPWLPATLRIASTLIKVAFGALLHMVPADCSHLKLLAVP